MEDEITGMFQIAKILDALDEPARARVLRWAADKYGIDLGQIAAEDEDAEASDRVMSLGVDPEKVAAAKQAREGQATEGAAAEQLEVKPASTLESVETPPERDPERPSFLDTSFRMHSAKKELKKAKDEKK